MERCESDVMSFVDYFFPHHWVLNYAFAYQGFIVGTIAGACRFYNHSGTWRCDYIDHFKCKSEILWSPNSSVSAMITEPRDSISLSRWKHPTRERIICAREEKVSFQSDQQSEGSFLPWFIWFIYCLSWKHWYSWNYWIELLICDLLFAVMYKWFQ